MNLRWTAALPAALLLLATACGGGGGGGSATPGVSAPAPTPSPTPSLYPTASSAATYILGSISTTVPTPAPGPNVNDDGGWSRLQLPAMQSCGNGAVATDCSVWIFAAASGSSTARAPMTTRRPQTPLVGTRPPVLNFCRNAASYPSDIGAPALVMTGSGGTSFSLTYSGQKATPIVSFATAWWALGVTKSFSGSATVAPAVTVTPALTDTAARGWLLFFTWSWPADVIAIPYGVNEIQLGAPSSPLAIPPGSSGRLGAFDCVGDAITATSQFGSGFGFSADLLTSSVTSAGELNVPVYTGASPSGSAVLFDAAGSTVTVPVT